MTTLIGEEIGSSRTLGPWSVDPNTGLDVRGPDGKDVCVALCQEMGGMLFDKSTIGPERRQQAFDNALLIAAAPELLALCKDMENWLRPEVIKEPDRSYFWKLVAVIKKAEGRS